MNYSEFSLKSAGFAAEGGTRGGSGLKWLGTAPSMEVTWGVSLVELKRAFRRLSARLSDEFGAGGAFVVLIARDDKLEITANRIPEGLSASVVCPGRARACHFPSSEASRESCVPIAGQPFDLLFPLGALSIDRTEFRQVGISARPTRGFGQPGRLRPPPSLVAVLLRILQDFA
jgi:hypothetical protein